MGIAHRPRHIDNHWFAKGPIGPYVDAFKQHLAERDMLRTRLPAM